MRKKHIQGGEKEYGIIPIFFLESRDEKGVINPHKLFFTFAPIGSHRDRWLKNMGRLYIDTGDHPEYASPECATPRDAVVWQKAGDRILADTVDVVNTALWKAVSDGTAPQGVHSARMEEIKTYVKENELLPHSEILRIYRNSIDGENNRMFADHENHIMQRAVDIEKAYDVLLIHCISRIIWQGSGVIVYHPLQKKYEYHLSQRACHIDKLIDASTTNPKKPIINTRDEPHADMKEWRRVHIIGGDANMAEVASRLKYGTTMMLILMIEDGFFNDKHLAEDRDTLLRCYRQFSFDSTLRVKQRMLGGMYSALDLQRMLLGFAQEYFAAKDYGPLTEEIMWQLEWWQKILDIAAGPDPLLRMQRYTDHAKYALMVADMKRLGYSWDSSSDTKVVVQRASGSPVQMTVHGRLKYLDIEYHRISNRFGIFQRIPMERICTDREIDYAVEFPPPNTRASARRAIVDMCVAKADCHLETIGWMSLGINIGGLKQDISLTDPFNSRVPPF